MGKSFLNYLPIAEPLDNGQIFSHPHLSAIKRFQCMNFVKARSAKNTENM